MARKDNLYYDITIDTGGDFELSFTLYGEGSTVVDLTGAIVRAQLREYPEGSVVTDFVCTHNDDGGQITISMVHEVTRDLGYTYGWFDVKVEYPDQMVEEVMHGKAFISANITRPQNDGIPYTVVAFESFDDFPSEGNSYRIYLDREYGQLYYWTGTQYLPLLYQLKGDAATIEIGDVITGDPGTPVIVTNSGDQHHAVFDFTIPRGEQGVLFPTGNWDGTLAYNKLDLVIYDGSSYVAKENVPAGTPITDTNYWQLIAQKGDRGSTGYTEIVTSSFDPTATYEVGDVVIYNGDVYRILQPYEGEGGWEAVVARKLAVMDHKTNHDVIARTFDTTTYYNAGEYVFFGKDLYRFTEDHEAGIWDNTQVESVVVTSEIADLEEALMKVGRIIARPYSEAEDYSVGDYVIYNGYLYRFTEEHEAGPFDGTQVDVIIISDKLQRLDSTKALAYMDSIDYESNYITNKPRTKPAPITTTTDDTPANWLAVGNGYFYYDTAGQLNDQPTASGILSNVVISGDTFTDVIQIWSNIPTGEIYVRGGDANGWSSGGWLTYKHGEYLPLTGGTMTGNISTKSGSIDLTQEAPSATQFTSAHAITDKNGDIIGLIEGSRNTADQTMLRLSAKRIVNGNTYWNQIDLKINADGTRAYSISHPAEFRTAIGAVSKAGDTMTGTLTLASEGLKTPNTGGYVTDQYGNFRHQSTSTQNYFAIYSNAGVSNFNVNYETGRIGTKDGVEVTKDGGYYSLKTANGTVSCGGMLNNSNGRIFLRARNLSTEHYIDAYLPIPEAGQTSNQTRYIPTMNTGTNALISGTTVMSTNTIYLQYE